MPLNRFWSSVWSVAGFLLVVGWLQYLFSILLSLFGVLPYFAPALSELIREIGAGILPIWSALTFIDWKWGWKGDNAGFRTRFAAVFWYLPGLLGGGLAAALVWFLTGGLGAADLAISPDLLLWSGITLLQIFVTELVYRGVVTSRFQYDLSGWQRLAAAALVPPVWMVIQRVGFLATKWPETYISGIGTAALSVFLTLLFLRLDSVWLSAGLHGGLRLGLLLPLGTQLSPAIEQSLFLLFAPLAAILLFVELQKKGPSRPTGGQRRGPQRVVFGKTVRGPWGPH